MTHLRKFILYDANGRELELTDNSNVPVEIKNSDGNAVDAQHPLSVDGESVNINDIWQSQSNMGDFSGLVSDLFDNLHTVTVNNTSNNPKEILIHFQRSTVIYAIGLGAFTGNFSNVEIQFITSGGGAFTAYDGSADSTKETSLTRLFNIIAGGNAIKLKFHTADTVSLSNVFVFTSTATISRIQAVSDLSDEVEQITSYRGAINVNPAYVHRKILNESFHQHTGDSTTPSVAISEGDTDITFTSVVGFAIGSEIKLEEGSIQEIGLMTITNIVGNVVTIDRPVGNDYTTSATIDEVTSNMAVVGTLASPEIFEIDPPTGVIWQFTRIIPTILDNLAMDDGKFGGVAALTNGVALRASTAAGRTVVYANWKTNGDIRSDMYDVEYLDKAPAGLYGLGGRWTFTKLEVVAELDGDTSPLQKLEVLIQDDLSALTSFKMKAQGRVFSP
jgi:hypothetical protein